MVSSRLLRSRTLECSPAAAMSRTWSITLILPGNTVAPRRHRGTGSGGQNSREPRAEARGKFQNGDGAGVLPVQTRLRPPKMEVATDVPE